MAGKDTAAGYRAPIGYAKLDVARRQDLAAALPSR
jgi:hypothetical protein